MTAVVGTYDRGTLWTGVRANPYLCVRAVPSTLEGFVWFNVVSQNGSAGYERPLRVDALEAAVRCASGHALSDFDWKPATCEPYERSPFALPARRRTGFVYFIQAEAGGLIKIGFATDVTGRLDTLQTGSPVKLVVVGSMPGVIQDESGLHERFAHLRRHGEWFESADDLLRFIEESASP